MKEYTQTININDISFEYVNTKQGKACDNIICFDIETTSAFLFPDGRLEMFDKDKAISYFSNTDLPDHKRIAKYYKDSEKVSICYLWKCAIDYNVFGGRTLESFVVFLDDLIGATGGANLFCYIHNAAFEVQFLLNVLDNIEVFARKSRKPIYFKWRNIEFRCSYMLTRLGLEKWAKSKKLAHQKLMGSLDYNVMRTPLTKITQQEDDYAVSDVLVMVDGLQEYKERYGHIYNIPITQTGIVRREFNNLMHDEKKYQFKMRSLIPSTLEEYSELVDIFGGGLTRGNRLLAAVILDNVWSRDATSAYPWAMLSKKYPMTKFVPINDKYEMFMNNLDYS